MFKSPYQQPTHESQPEQIDKRAVMNLAFFVFGGSHSKFESELGKANFPSDVNERFRKLRLLVNERYLGWEKRVFHNKQKIEQEITLIKEVLNG